MIAGAALGFALAHISIRLIEKVTDIPSAIILQFVTTFGVWILAEQLRLSPIVTIVTTPSRRRASRRNARRRACEFLPMRSGKPWCSCSMCWPSC